MIDKTQRIIIEAIKRQPYLTIELPSGDRLTITGKQVARDIALSIQQHFNRL